MYQIEMINKRGRVFILAVKAECLLEAVEQALRSLGDIYQDVFPERSFDLPEYMDVVRIYGKELA